MRGSPGAGLMGGWGEGGWATPTHMCTHMHMHACAHRCAHTHTHVKHDKHGCLHGGGHLQFSNMLILAFHVCACEHTCVYMSGGTAMPQMPPHPSAPFPRAAGSPNHQQSISPELIEIIRFCLKILYL